jgi:FtsP/CotA-like multicopper oxidase with cupredoxin domain
MFLQDWYILTGTQQMIGLESLPFAWVGNPQSFLINGKGLAPACAEQDGGVWFNDTSMCLTDVCANATTNATYMVDGDAYNVTTVELGKTYRFRIINSAQLIMFNYAIANHNLTVVAVEGTYLANPFVVESLDVAPGERYDVLVTANQDPNATGIEYYWIETMARYREVPGVFGRALLKYATTRHTTSAAAGTNETNATETTDNDVIIFSDYPNHPEWNNSAPGMELDEALATANVEAHPRESAALTADEADIARFILVGTQNSTLHVCCCLCCNGLCEMDVLLFGLFSLRASITHVMISPSVAHSHFSL